jgi:hypothetical protein
MNLDRFKDRSGSKPCLFCFGQGIGGGGALAKKALHRCARWPAGIAAEIEDLLVKLL